jgi:O-antigen/teichoic acid export membrane protein
MATQLANLGIYQSQPLIITQMLGPSKVAIFVIAYKVISAPVDFSYIATTPFVSAFSEAKARNDWQWIRSAFKNSTLACLVIGIPVTIGIGLAGKVLVRMLGGPQVVPDWGLIIWLSVYTLIGMGFMTLGQVLCGLEKIGILAISLTASAVGTVALGIWFAHPWGLNGVAAGMALAKVLAYSPLQGYQARQILRYADGQIKNKLANA